jgi:putative nucleotidyltransferase with HDIG domain
LLLEHPLTLEELSANSPELRAKITRISALVSAIEASMSVPDFSPGQVEPGAPERKAAVEAVARFFDDRLEFAPYEPIDMEQVRRELAEMADSGFLNLEATRALTELQLVTDAEILAEAQQLPVFPAALYKAITASNHPDANLKEIEKALSGDAVLAGRLIEVANSPLYPRFVLSNSVRDAVIYLGLETTRRILAAAAIRPLVASSNVQTLWKHALRTAEAAESLARLHGSIDPLQAYLAGLMHDIGRLIFERLPRPVLHLYREFTERGCPLTWSERVLCGMDHGEAGAIVLAHWNFPEEIVEAVRHHHSPEQSDSPLASLLYIAEEISGEEAVPSGVRTDLAHDVTGLDFYRARVARVMESAYGARLSLIS